MSIETLRNLKTVNGKGVMTNEDRPVLENGNVDWNEFDKMRESNPICIDHETDMISFKMLTKPASEGGNLNLCQLTELIVVAQHMLQELNEYYPCAENAKTIGCLEESLAWQKQRTENRIARGVEGLNEK